MKITIVKYLQRRLLELGIHHLFGVPGDFNLTLLKSLTEEGLLKWVNSTNELNAGYIADGYGRSNHKMGVFLTTYGVGELCAVNAVAGAFAEYVPVLHIVGIPSLSKMMHPDIFHHTMSDNKMYHYFNIFKEVTNNNAVVLDCKYFKNDELLEKKIINDINLLLIKIIETSRPGYLAIPTDVVDVKVDDSYLSTTLALAVSPDDEDNAFEKALRIRLSYATNVIGLVGILCCRKQLQSKIESLIGTDAIALASMVEAQTIIPPHKNNLGLYIGKITPNVKCEQIVNNAKSLILIGAVLSELALGNFTHKFFAPDAIEIGLSTSRIGKKKFQIRLDSAIDILTKVLSELKPKMKLPIVASKPVTFNKHSKQSLTQHIFWSGIDNWINTTNKPTNVIVEVGTSFFSATTISYPSQVRFYSGSLWASIGYVIPATFGIALTDTTRQNVVFTGDGAAQLTIQELSSILIRKLDVIIFLLNNRGYTVERAIMHPHDWYHDINIWNWRQLVESLTEKPQIKTYVVYDAKTLNSTLSKLSNAKGVHFVEVLLGAHDIPEPMNFFFAK